MKKLFAVALSALLSLSAQAGPLVTYAASPQGGDYGMGAIYEVVGKEHKVIYSFCPYNGCGDGANPLANVRVMPDGSILGVTSHGGYSIYGVDGGVIFRLHAVNNAQTMGKTEWIPEVVMKLCPYWQECTHYGHPSAITFTEDGNWINGITQNDDGTMGVTWKYKIESPSGQGVWSRIHGWGKEDKSRIVPSQSSY